MRLVVAWVSVATSLGVLMRRVGPWWRVVLGCAVWPAWPAIIAVSYARYRTKKVRTNVSP